MGSQHGYGYAPRCGAAKPRGYSDDTRQELTCLYKVSSLLRENKPFEQILAALPEIVDSAGHPPGCSARVIFDNVCFPATPSTDPAFSRASPILIDGQVRGRVALDRGGVPGASSGDETLADKQMFLDEVAACIADAFRQRIAEAKVNHTTTMLRAIRKTNRSVVQGEDPVRLLESVLTELVVANSLKAAWVRLSANAPGGERTFERGIGPAFDALSAKVQSGWLPGCCHHAARDAGTTRTESPEAVCTDCPLADKGNGPERVSDVVLTTSIRMEETIYGFMCASVSQDVAAVEETAALLRALADDIAFAFRSIELKQVHEATEEALKKEALRRQILMGASQDGIAIINQSHQIVEANQRFAQMLGYAPEELLSLHTWDFEAMMPKEEIRINFADLTKTYGTFESKHRRKDGSLYDVEVSASGAMVGDEPMVFTVSRDITEKRQMQATLAQSDRLATMGVMAAGVAHEINNPLAYVLYNLESLTDEVPGLVDELRRWREFAFRRPEDAEARSVLSDTPESRSPLFFQDMADRFQEALSGVRRIQAITRALGTFSRVEQDQLVPVNVRYIIECAINMAFNEIKYRAKLVKDFAPVDSVLGSDGCLSQVFLNLLINAAHAIPEGAVNDNEIRVKTWQEGEDVCVEIRDTGAGIREEHLERIFEPFFSTKGVGVGSGLGLAISRNIITGYGGRIEVHSEFGIGTSFFIRLPTRRSARGDRSSQPPQPAAPPTVKGRILVVDDEESICRAIKRILSDHDVVAACTGEQAQTILERDSAFDLVLCDMMMPYMSGMAFHDWLKSEHPRLANQFVFITGGAFTPKSREYLSIEGNRYIEKPFDSAQLKSLAGELVAAYRRGEL